EFEISDGNSDRNWQDKPVASSFLYSVGGHPAYLPVPKEFDPNTTVTVSVTPVRPVTSAGVLKFTFLGYKNLVLPRVVWWPASAPGRVEASPRDLRIPAPPRLPSQAPLTRNRLRPSARRLRRRASAGATRF